MPTYELRTRAASGRAPNQQLPVADGIVEPAGAGADRPTVRGSGIVAPREALRLQRQIGNAAVTRLLGGTDVVQRMMGENDAVDLTWLYRVSDTHPKDLADDFGVAPPIYAAVFPAAADPADIKTTLIGFSQQSGGAWLYRFPQPAAVTMGNVIPQQYWKGSVTGGQELTADAVAVDTVEVKVGAAWKTVSQIKQQVAAIQAAASGAAK